MRNVTALKCISCSASYGSVPPAYICPACGGVLDIEYDYGAVSAGAFLDGLARPAPAHMWRYSALLPVDVGGPLPRLSVGGTPLYRRTPLGEELGLCEVMVKDDGLNPTGSLKDRASAVAVAAALQQGAKTVSCASTGNAASSCAGCAASVGMRSVIFVPRRAPRQAGAAGCVRGGSRQVLGDYEQAFSLSAEAISVYGGTTVTPPSTP